MDDHQYGVPAASPNRTAGSDGHFKTLVSAIERSGIIERSRINAFASQFARAATTPVAPWARSDDTDIDTEILQWIVSHVPSARRSKPL